MTVAKKWAIAQAGGLGLGIGLVSDGIIWNNPWYWLIAIPYAVVSNVIALREPPPRQEIKCKNPLTK